MYGFVCRQSTNENIFDLKTVIVPEFGDVLHSCLRYWFYYSTECWMLLLHVLTLPNQIYK